MRYLYNKYGWFFMFKDKIISTIKTINTFQSILDESGRKIRLQYKSYY